MKVSLISFGKLKTAGMRDVADHYLHLIRPWVKIEEIEIGALSVPDKSESTRKAIQEKEAMVLTVKLKSISPNEVYLMHEKGKALPTLQWAEEVNKWESNSISHVAICIGSSLGFSDELRKKYKMLSLGPQTVSHELARVILLEQLYRAWSVERGHPYHNEG
jgi:23S rRNA (pseudouridine1915-N3)-methyltransferase